MVILLVRSYNLELRGMHISSRVLLCRAAKEDTAVKGMQSGMDCIAELVAATILVDDYVNCNNDDRSLLCHCRTPRRTPPAAAAIRVSRLLQLMSACKRLQSDVTPKMSALERELALAHRRLCHGLLFLLPVEDELKSAAGECIADQRQRLEEEEEIKRLEGKARKEALRTMAAEDKQAQAEHAPTEGAWLKKVRWREERRRRMR